MKKAILICIALFITQLSSAQWGKRIKGNGNLETKTFNTSDYDAVSVAGSMDVRLVSGNEGTITVQAESNIMEYLKIEVKNDRLIIGTKNNSNISPRKSITVTVPVERIDAASVSGSGEIISDVKLKARNMELKVSGSGDMILNVECENMYASVTGSGDMQIQGRAENLEAKVTGSGDLDAYRLKANNVEAAVTGSGDLGVYVNNGSLKARVTGSGDIEYRGNASNVDKKVTGSGDIDRG